MDRRLGNPLLAATLCMGVLLVLSRMSTAETLHWPDPLSEGQLEQLRGGFLVGDLEIFIGLEQVVAVNGEDLVLTRLTIPDLNQQMGPGELDQLLETGLMVPEASLPDGLVIQTELTDNSGILTRIQNSLDESVIQTLRQLNIEFNNLDPGSFHPRYQDAAYLQTLHLR